jgi:hypothetical protein
MSEESSWTNDIDIILENIRTNSITLSKEHKTKYFYTKHILQYFKLPIIIISAFNSAFSVGLQPYTAQQNISIINCGLALICSIVGSIEIYLGLSKQVEDEYLISKEYYLLSINVYKILSLEHGNRPTDSRIVLESFWNEYSKLIDKSLLIDKKILDSLQPIPTGIAGYTSVKQSPSSDNQREFSLNDIMV